MARIRSAPGITLLTGLVPVCPLHARVTSDNAGSGRVRKRRPLPIPGPSAPSSAAAIASLTK